MTRLAHLRRRAAVEDARPLAGVCIGVLMAVAVTAAWSQAAQPSTAPASPPASVPARSATPSRGEEGVRWAELAPAQRAALAPLEREWSGIDGQRKQKWLVLAERFPTLSPDERGRITARMSEWARLTPAERGQARLRFEEVRQVAAPDRNARWEAYQALPADTKQQLAARAASAAASGPADAARHEAGGKPTRSPARDTREAKANLVPSAAPTRPPKQVAPTLVQAGPGATTTLITRRPAPPAHQQTGMPKIAATPEFVNRSTLLPKSGPQAATVTPPRAPMPASSAPALPLPAAPPASRPR